MPSTSKKQHNFMAAIAHSPSFAKKVGVAQSVGKDFNEADKGRKFSKGGDMDKKKLFSGKESMAEEMKEAKAIKSGKISPKEYAMGEKSEEKKMKKGGSCYAKGGGIESKGKTKGKMFAKGGGIEIKGKTRGKEC